ncbi:MAG: 3-oxoacyl-[acyl-carrier protein] reductase [Candidatus Marivariicella framensis]|jgi:3-oxoacyl-[acyl-carrier protein] reductase
MEISLKGKQALIGGSSKGIGLAIAKQLASSGASVCLMARNKSKMKEIIKNLPSDKGQVHHFLQVDFSDFNSFKVKLDVFFKENKIDILVNNTQGPPSGNSLSKSIQDYQISFDLLFKNIVYATTLAMSHMKRQGWGRIINIASISVREPLNYLVLSNTIRAAVVAWGKSLSFDVAQYGITVNSVLTGYFDTERIAQLNAAKAKSLNISESQVLLAMKEMVPVNRLGIPEEYGYLVSFLASNKAAYINGTAIPIDGGLLKSY